MKRPLWQFGISVVIALAIVNLIAWRIDSEAVLRASELVSIGFLLGMFAMYVAMHLYRRK